MNHHYIEYNFTVNPLIPGSEILMAELGELEFDSFVETETGLLAYVPAQLDDEKAVQSLQILKHSEFKITYQRTDIEPVNWNEEWEKNFSPIAVDGLCYIRATFHDPKPEYPYEIVIDPKMSFGTGHHETTSQMIQQILKHDFENKTVLDMGCGTGILAMLSKMRGAEQVDAIDIDEWAIDNAAENAKRNATDIQLKLGDASLLNATEYAIILANINRNILLQDCAIYCKVLQKNGSIFLSGFYEEDLPIIRETFEQEGLTFKDYTTQNRWVSAWFVK